MTCAGASLAFRHAVWKTRPAEPRQAHYLRDEPATAGFPSIPHED